MAVDGTGSCIIHIASILKIHKIKPRKMTKTRKSLKNSPLFYAIFRATNRYLTNPAKSGFLRSP